MDNFRGFVLRLMPGVALALASTDPHVVVAYKLSIRNAHAPSNVRLSLGQAPSVESATVECSELYLAVGAPALVALHRAVNNPLAVPGAPGVLPSTETPSAAALPLPLDAVGVAKDFALFDQLCAFLRKYVPKTRTETRAQGMPGQDNNTAFDSALN